MIKKLTILILSLIIALSYPAKIYATRLDDLRKQKEEAERELNRANSNVSSLNKQKSAIENEISELDAQLVDTITAVSLLEDQIDALKLKIEETRRQYEEAKAVEAAQYEAMKLRIKYMYERGDTSYVDVLLQAKSFSDIVNKADYIELLYEYDRKMLLEYEAAKNAVAETKDRLEKEEEQLEVDLSELEEEKEQLDMLMEEKKAEAADFDNQIARAKQEAAAYKAKIKQQNAEIKKIEQEEAKKKAAEAAAREAASKNAAGTGGTSAAAKSNTETASNVISGSGGSALGKQIANYGCKFIGNPYVSGGTSLTNGCDCSGFTYSVYKDCGVSIPRAGAGQRAVGRGVSYSEAVPGDIICYPGHVGIYIGGGQIVHASTPSGGIKIGSATYTTILTVRRVVN